MVFFSDAQIGELVASGELVPSDYALKMRPAFVCTLFMISLIIVGKLIVNDFWGATTLMIVLIMGIFVVVGQYAVNASSALLFSAMCAMTMCFDILSLVLYAHFSKYRMFDMHNPGMVLLAQTIFVCSPICLSFAAALSYSMFSDCRSVAEENGTLSEDYGDSYGAMEEAYNDQVLIRPVREPQVKKAAVFQGKGFRFRDVD
eukprot:TRINITY_DN3307_c2_g1_i1.p1 TRINITY_DN3307_c2_g1~~TRINITY_DN3307_c2_g1_i1.p1  ORF type:complete len:202 (+),score=30.20 TRINITY_DN3307_c2_g1_i1:193-798(+)